MSFLVVCLVSTVCISTGVPVLGSSLSSALPSRCWYVPIALSLLYDSDSCESLPFPDSAAIPRANRWRDQFKRDRLQRSTCCSGSVYPTA
ncbi:hypothetical protein C8F01DRAFT_1186271 [Mycena amicta]|nr:hypothetical protein C8F01DRAFT_1186271 [Mycena amicta]